MPRSPNGDGNGVLIRQNLGSSPRRGFVAEVAQSVELLPSKQKVAGSSPVLRSQAIVAELAYARDLKSRFCGFDSHRWHLVKLRFTFYDSPEKRDLSSNWWGKQVKNQVFCCYLNFARGSSRFTFPNIAPLLIKINLLSLSTFLKPGFFSGVVLHITGANQWLQFYFSTQATNR